MESKISPLKSIDPHGLGYLGHVPPTPIKMYTLTLRKHECGFGIFADTGHSHHYLKNFYNDA